MWKWGGVLTCVLTAALAMAGCGGNAITKVPLVMTQAAPGDAQTVNVELKEYKIIMPTQLRSGPTIFNVTNTGKRTHNFAIEGPGVKNQFVDDIKTGEGGQMLVTLSPGKYQVWCPVGPHSMMGMKLDVLVTGGEPVRTQPY